MACTNQTVRLDGSGSSDADGAVNAFSWNFGDGSTGGGERPTHVFERPGTYTVAPHHHRRRPRRLRRARHRRDHGDRRRGAAHRDRRPRPRRRRRRRRLRRGAGRRRSTCAAPRFGWDFGDGATATGPTVEHAFAEPGARTVHAARGAARRQRRLRHHRDPADRRRSTRRRRRSSTRRTGSPPARSCSSTPSASTDPDGAITGFEWDFGDGATATRRAGAAPLRRRPAPTGCGWRRPTTPASATAASRPTRTVEVTPAARWPT